MRRILLFSMMLMGGLVSYSQNADSTTNFYTTWREIGFGITGDILPASLKYQVYIINGFNGYDGTARISGKNGLRKGC